MRILSEKSDSRRSPVFMVNSEHISKYSLVLSIVKIEKVNACCILRFGIICTI